MSMKRLLSIILAIAVVIGSSHWVSSVLASKLYDGGSYALAGSTWQLSRLTPFSNDLAIRYNIGNSHYQRGDYELAIDEYTQVINSNDLLLVCPALYNWAQSLVGLGDADRDQDQIEEAIADYSKALALVSRQSCTQTQEFNEQFTALAEEIQQRIEEAAAEAQQEPDEEGEEPSDARQRKVDEELEEELDNIDEEVEQLQRGDNDDRFDEARETDDFDVIW